MLYERMVTVQQTNCSAVCRQVVEGPVSSAVLASAAARLAAVVPLPPTLDQTVTTAPIARDLPPAAAPISAAAPQLPPPANASLNKVQHQCLLCTTAKEAGHFWVLQLGMECVPMG